MQHALSDDSKGRAFTWYSIRSEISIVNRLFRTIASLKFLDDATASPSKFCLALARTMQSTTLISVWMEH